MERDLDGIRKAFPELNEMQNQNWAKAVVSIWEEVLKRSDWQRAEDARFSIGANEISLIGHTRAVLDLALSIADSLKNVHGRDVELDRDVLVAGCILHDVDKLLALAPDGNGGCIPTDIGYNVQHGFYSAYYAEKAGLPQSIVTLIINHTAFSRMMPSTLESVILFFADISDAEVVKFTYGHTPMTLKAIGKLAQRKA